MKRTPRITAATLGLILAGAAAPTAAFAAQDSPQILNISPMNAATANGSVDVSAFTEETQCVTVTARDGTSGAIVANVPLTAGETRGEFRGTMNLVEGSYRLTFTAASPCDASGPSDVRNTTLTVDATPPQPFGFTEVPHVTGKPMFLYGTSAQTATVSWDRARDNDAVERYVLRADGRDLITVPGGDRRATVPVDQLPASGQLQVVAYDRAGNHRASEPVAVAVDRSEPTVRWAGPKSGMWLRATANLSGAFSDVGSGLASAGIHRAAVTDRAPGAPSVGAAPLGNAPVSTFRWNTRSSLDGRHTLHAYAVDHAGNITSVPRDFWVDNTKPKFLTKARVMNASARRTNTRVALRIADELSPTLRLSTIIRVTPGSSMKAKRVAQRNKGNAHVGKPIVVKNGQKGLATKYVNVPGRKLGVGNYRLTLRVEDLAGNTITRAYTLRVR